MRGIVTGKDVRIGGSEGRATATGQGVAFCIEDYYAEKGETLKGKTFILQGFGNVGSHGADILQKHGRPSARGERRRRHHLQRDGIDVPALHGLRQRPEEPASAACSGFPGAQVIAKKDFWEVQADICFPAALGGEITGEVAERLKVKLIAEGANGPTTPEADRVLQQARHRHDPGHHRQRRRRDGQLLRVDPEQAHGALDARPRSTSASSTRSSATTASSATSRATRAAARTCTTAVPSSSARRWTRAARR